MLTYAPPSFCIQFYKLLPLMTISWVQPQQKQVNTIFSISSIVRKWCSAIKLSFLKCHRIISWSILKYQWLLGRMISSRYLQSHVTQNILQASKVFVRIWYVWDVVTEVNSFNKPAQYPQQLFPPYYILCTERDKTLTYAQWQCWQLLQIFRLITVCIRQPKWISYQFPFFHRKKKWSLHTWHMAISLN